MKRWIFLPAIIGLLFLSACGETKTPPDAVYVPRRVDCGIDGFTYVYQLCADDEYLYFIGADPVGQTDGQSEYAAGTFTDGLYRIPLTGGEAEALENYTEPVLPKGVEGEVHLRQVDCLGDGVLWVKEEITVYQFDCPPNFHAETGGKWRYWTGSRSASVWRRLDGTGRELEWLDSAELEKKFNMNYIGSVLPDPEGNLYVEQNNGVTVLDRDRRKLLFELDFGKAASTLVRGADGTMAVFFVCFDQESERYGCQLWLIDSGNQRWGERYELGFATSSVFTGNQEYPYYYWNGSSVWGWRDGESKRLFNWPNTSPDIQGVQSTALTPDGRAALVINGSENEDKTGLLLLTPTDPAALPEQTVLTMGVMDQGYAFWNRIQDFNRSHDGCRIEVVDYREYNTGSHPEAGLERLNEDIRVGKIPDLLCDGYFPQLPLNLYSVQGLLEDLWPYIDTDTGLGGRQALMEHILDAASLDGRLYQAFGSFDIRTATGTRAVTGGWTTWTVHDLKEALDAMPEGGTLFEGTENSREWFFRQEMTVTLDQFLDWGTGQCAFDSDAFRELLAFCKELPAEEELLDSSDAWSRGEDVFTRLENRKQLLRMEEYLSGFSAAKACRQQLRNGYSFIGFPRADGRAGSCFVPGDVIAMSSSCKDKDAAWAFIRQVFLPLDEEQDSSAYRFYVGGSWHFTDFPVNKADFEQMRDYVLAGEDPVTEEDVAQVMELYADTCSVYNYDEQLFRLIEEAAELYFNGERGLDATAKEVQKRVQMYIKG